MLSNRSTASPVGIEAIGNVPHASLFNQISFVTQDPRHDHKNFTLHKVYMPKDMPLPEAVSLAWDDLEHKKPRQWRKMQEGSLAVYATVEPDPNLRIHGIYPKG